MSGGRTEPATTECRASAGICDVAEFCTGASDACPADGFVRGDDRVRGGDRGLRRGRGLHGESAACPADGPNLTTECRASAGICDVAEFCSDAQRRLSGGWVRRRRRTECRGGGRDLRRGGGLHGDECGVSGGRTEPDHAVPCVGGDLRRGGEL